MSATQSFNAASKRLCILRFSTAADADALFDYYDSHRHHHVDPLDRDDVAATAAAGRYLMVTDPDGTIQMSSAAYDYADDKGNNRAWLEIGSTRAAIEGFGLYPYIIASQVVHAWVNYPPDHFIFADIFSDNLSVASMLEKKVGWETFTPDNDLLDAAHEQENQKNGRLLWLRVAPCSLPHQARLVQTFIENASQGILNRKTGDTLKLDISAFPLAHAQRQNLDALATLDTTVIIVQPAQVALAQPA